MFSVALVETLVVLLVSLKESIKRTDNHVQKGTRRWSTAANKPSRSLTLLRRTQIFEHFDVEDDPANGDYSFHYFMEYLESSSLSTQTKSSIVSTLKKIGFTNSEQLQEFSRDFVDRPETLSKVLQEDFGLSVLMSHQLRYLLIRMVKDNMLEPQRIVKDENKRLIESPIIIKGLSNVPVKTDIKMPLFKTVVVNQKAKQRHGPMIQKSDEEQEKLIGSYNYGFSSTDYPRLAEELQDFMRFMTQPQTNGQEPPIRKTTAQVYIRHAKLFLGWWIQLEQKKGPIDETDPTNLSLRTIFPHSQSSSAEPIISFILWLRQERKVTDSYEANMLRGLTKMMKFRFIDESRADPSYGEKTYHDIPIIRELRKLHREANKKQALSPRSSDEGLKWITWMEYLTVVKALKDDLMQEIQAWNNNETKDNRDRKMDLVHRRIAVKYQFYLIVAIFAHVPDRQRTVRELELGRTLHRDTALNCWVIKHGPDDYKTGATYGDRPPLTLTPELSKSMDDFLTSWRGYLKPTGSHFFVQTRTGRPLTQDSVYSIVARSCYKHTGKKTNPHLLRDMIVTHVRDSQASEKELEALALYMGHSISMQRTSYDRRTMQQKVAPAIELLKSVNEVGNI
jgi:hypothetical protein